MLPEKQTEIDLPPQEWKSADERQKPREPFFGTGAWGMMWYWLGFAVMAVVVRYFTVSG